MGRNFKSRAHDHHTTVQRSPPTCGLTVWILKIRAVRPSCLLRSDPQPWSRVTFQRRDSRPQAFCFCYYYSYRHCHERQKQQQQQQQRGDQGGHGNRRTPLYSCTRTFCPGTSIRYGGPVAKRCDVSSALLYREVRTAPTDLVRVSYATEFFYSIVSTAKLPIPECQK